MISELMWSPIPWVLAAFIYSALSWQRIRDRPWAKWPRRIIGITLPTLLITGLIMGFFSTLGIAKRHQQQVIYGQGGLPSDELRTNAAEFVAKNGFANPQCVEVATVTFKEMKMGFAVGLDTDRINRVFVIINRENGKCRFATDVEARSDIKRPDF